MTKYIKEENLDKDIILKIGNDLKEGQIAIFKTDTVYGICTNAFLEKSCMRIYEVKGRPAYKPLTVLISDISMLNGLVETINPIEQKLIDTFWPGPLTIKFKKKVGILPEIVSAGDEFVRVRLLKDEPAYNLISSSHVPLVAPSANLSGNPTGINIENIKDEFDGKVDYIIDSGNITNDTTSTIVEVKDGKVIIIREGKILKSEIAKLVPIEE